MAAPPTSGDTTAESFAFETWTNPVPVTARLPSQQTADGSSAPVPARLGLCCCNSHGTLEKQPPDRAGFGTSSGHRRLTAADAADGLGGPQMGLLRARPSPPKTVRAPLGAPSAFEHVAPSQIPSRAPMRIPAEPDTRSLSAWLQRLPRLYPCPPTPGSTWRGGKQVGSHQVVSMCLCFTFPLLRAGRPVQPPQQRWVPAQAEGSGAHWSQHQQHVPIPEQTRGWSAAPRLSGLGLGLGSSRSVPGVWSGGSLERCNSRTAVPGLGGCPSNQPCDVSLTIIAGLVLLLRCYSRKSRWRGISDCPPAFITCSSCCPLTRLHCSSQLSMSVLCCRVFCSLLEREPYLQLRSGPGQPRAPCPSAQQSWGTRTSPWRASSALCPGGDFFPQNQCFTLRTKQEDLYF